MAHLSPPTPDDGASPLPSSPLSVVVVSGNPRPGSRTLAAATTLGERIAALLDAGRDTQSPTTPTTIDLATFASEILTADHPAADRATATSRGPLAATSGGTTSWIRRPSSMSQSSSTPRRCA